MLANTACVQTCHTQNPLTDTHAHPVPHTQVWLLWAKSTYGPIIWSLKVFGLIFNSAGERVCQLLDCLNHIIPLLCILMNVHQAKRCVRMCVCGREGMWAFLWTAVCICMPGIWHGCARVWPHITAFPGTPWIFIMFSCGAQKQFVTSQGDVATKWNLFGGRWLICHTCYHLPHHAK